MIPNEGTEPQRRIQYKVYATYDTGRIARGQTTNRAVPVAGGWGEIRETNERTNHSLKVQASDEISDLVGLLGLLSQLALLDRSPTTSTVEIREKAARVKPTIVRQHRSPAKGPTVVLAIKLAL